MINYRMIIQITYKILYILDIYLMDYRVDNTITKFLNNEPLQYYNINYIKNTDIYRIYPVNDSKTIKLRVSSLDPEKNIHKIIPHNKIILKIEVADNKKLIKNEILLNQKLQRELPNNNIPEILGVYKIDATSLKTLLNKLPTKYITDLSEFIKGEYILLVYENYENLFHMGKDMILVDRMDQITTDIDKRTMLFLSFLFYLVHYYQNDIDTSTIDIFNIGFRYTNNEKNIYITENKNKFAFNASIPSGTTRGLYIEPVIIDFINGSSSSKNIFNVNNFMPFGKEILYKYLTESLKFPYFPIQTIKNIFGDISTYLITNLSWINIYTSDINNQISYLTEFYNNYTNRDQNLNFDDITNTRILDVIQGDILIKCNDMSLKCMNDEVNKFIDKINIKLLIKPPDNKNPTTNGKIPQENYKLYENYENSYGENIFGTNNGISDKEKILRRICLGRYQYSQLKNAYLLARSILEKNTKFFDTYLESQMDRMLNLFQKELYTVNGEFRKDLFSIHFLLLTTDFVVPQITNFEHSVYLERSYIDMIYNFIIEIKEKGNFRNKLFIYLAFSKILHYALIRKLFMVQYVNESGLDKKILFDYGINNNQITLDKIDQSNNFDFDVETYCETHGLNFTLISHRYNMTKILVPLKKDDIGTSDIKTYLFDVLDRNIKFVFLLYLYEDFKNGIYGRVRFDWSKIKPKDYILVPRKSGIIYPDVDLYEFYRQKGDSISFLDRGIDTQRMSVLDKDNIFLESFKNGEPVLAGASGHTADILLCAGYLEPSNNLENYLNSMKIMTILCIAVMFPRKDHSIFEMYRALQLFNQPFNTDIFTCPSYNVSNGSCFKWLLENNNYVIGDNFFNGSHVYSDLKRNVDKSFEYYLSPEYIEIIQNILNIFYNHGVIINLQDLLALTENIVRDKFSDVYAELFIIMSIVRRENEKLWMTDAEYAYNIERKHWTIRDFINNNYSVPEILVNDDIFLYEDDVVTCTRSVYDIIKPIDDFDNICLILQKIYRKLSSKKCIR
ncbi:hypothetical protein QJ856_gp0772 [Tupanvirus deep ocean]|uniref:Uncharacterized protein n=2 Tax=Tupanvirus TaxID=2094720 RepID=A0AC62A879_9VIRU|nr:hypothetical protein QJ856_gp0772 [Tupanvirus deep ocean]QKU33980.1 hypothetical protein [Tupanvirus deep ocean]